MKLLLNAPINSLSFGNVSVNILKEIYKKNHELTFFPIGDKVQIQAFDKSSEGFISFLNDCTKKRYHTIDKDLPSLKLWHIFNAIKFKNVFSVVRCYENIILKLQ